MDNKKFKTDDTVSEYFLGQRWGECTAVAGGVGCGKTVIAHMVSAYNINEHKEPTFAVLLEEANNKTVRNIKSKIDGLNYGDPMVYEMYREKYMDTVTEMDDKLFLWDSKAPSSYRFDIEEIVAAIRYNYFEHGCRRVMLDNFTKLVYELDDPSTKNNFITRWSGELCNLAAELDLTVMAFSHLNAPPEGKRSHEEGGGVLSKQMTGSRAIMRDFANILGFERNTLAEGDDIHNSFLVPLKCRDYGAKPKIKTRYDENTTRLEEYEWDGDKLWEDKRKGSSRSGY